MDISLVLSSTDTLGKVEAVDRDKERPWAEQRVRIEFGANVLFLTRPDAQELAHRIFSAASTPLFEKPSTIAGRIGAA